MIRQNHIIIREKLFLIFYAGSARNGNDGSLQKNTLEDDWQVYNVKSYLDKVK